MSSEPTPTTDTMSAEEVARALGWDTNRVWSNNVQIFKNPDHVIFVFREMVELDAKDEQGTLKKEGLAKNVASVVLPLDVAKSFAEIMRTAFLAESDAEQG